jgi:hypothetical protein
MSLEDTISRMMVELEELRGRVADLERVQVLYVPVWDDLRIAATATNLGGSKDPGYAKFIDDVAGSSQGVFLFWFDAGTEEELYFEIQIPHAYKEGTTIMPHVHWVPKSGGSAGQVVSWGLEYAWKNIGGTFGDTTIIYGNAHTPADASLVASKHYLTPIGSGISGSSMTLSSMLVCRLFRDATAAGATDSYTADAGLLEFDLHIQMDALGSRQETVK